MGALHQEHLVLVLDLALEEGEGPPGAQRLGLDGDLLPHGGGLHVGEVHVDADPGARVPAHRQQRQRRHRVHQVGGEPPVQSPAPAAGMKNIFTG